MKQGGGVAGHNGLKDISARLATHDYWRLRIGIGHPGDRHAVTDYVLHRPSQEDRAAIDEAITRALEVLPLAIAGDVQGAMLKLHTAPEPVKAEKAPAPAKPERPAKPRKPAKAEKGPQAAQAATPGPVSKPAPAPAAAPAEKRSGLGSLFDRFRKK
jgi:hypothetical protein